MNSKKCKKKIMTLCKRAEMDLIKIKSEIQKKKRTNQNKITMLFVRNCKKKEKKINNY